MQLRLGVKEWFFVINLLFFYGWLLPFIGNHVQEKCESSRTCARHLQRTVYGYSVDLADGQWREFRGSLWLLLATMIGTATVSRILEIGLIKYYSIAYQKILRSCYRLTVGIIVLFIQHGYHSFIIVTIAGIGFCLAHLMSHTVKWRTPLIWIFAVGILLFKESYRLRHIQSFSFLHVLFDRRYGGMYGWQLPANFLVLRIVSYCFDFYWNCDNGSKAQRLPDEDSSSYSNSATMELHASGLDKGMTRFGSSSVSTKSISSRDHHSVSLARPPSDYGFLHYAAYILYAPLYIAGPVITFNQFMHFSEKPQQQESVLIYAARLLGCIGLMEYMTQRLPFFAVIQSGMLSRLEVHEIAVVCYLTLKMMWLKFLIIWRLFRLWALADGIIAPENMTKCMSNNYSLEQFWKGWHSSFNQWIVRYIYKPLGGRSKRVLSVWVIFLFVALWHDMEVKLLMWGLLNSFFYVLEVVVKHLVASSHAIEALPNITQQFLAAFAGASYIIVLIGINLIGYAVGVGGITVITGKACTWEGLVTLLVTLYFLTAGVALMKYLKDAGVSKYP